MSKKAQPCERLTDRVDNPPNATTDLSWPRSCDEPRNVKVCTSTRGTGTSCGKSQGTLWFQTTRLALEKRCSALKSENDRIRRELAEAPEDEE